MHVWLNSEYCGYVFGDLSAVLARFQNATVETDNPGSCAGHTVWLSRS